jgi:putative ABC transport system permease protein
VRVGDAITVEHPQATSQGLRTVISRVLVVGLHPNPMRAFAYFDSQAARIYGLTGMTNLLTVTPAPGVDTDAVRRALLTVPQVASTEAVKTTTKGMRSSLQEFLGILQVAAAIALLLALLIAFNTASIGMDERSREHATMLAFGLPARTVLGMAVIENGVIGLLATMLGILGGRALLGWMAATTLPATLPEIGVVATVAGSTLVWASILGILTVALAPLLTVRRLHRMDIPSTLRIVE